MRAGGVRLTGLGLICMDNWWNELALVATVGLVAVGVLEVGSGRAADLPVKAPAPKVAPYSFTGCYVGGFCGLGGGEQMAIDGFEWL